VKNILIIASAAASICLTATLGGAADSDVNPAAAAAARSKVMSVCQNCHGPQGDSVSPIFPRLNGQQADYIVAQLKSLRSHKRKDTRAQGYMWGIARDLDDTMIVALGEYFAGQTPTQPQTGGALAAEGENIFMNGVAAEGIPPCQACHGEYGEGRGGLYPRIAGQHADYLRMALGAFRSTLRGNKIMHANTRNMTDREIEALASYLAND
jgi:cytochrome c553